MVGASQKSKFQTKFPQHHFTTPSRKWFFLYFFSTDVDHMTFQTSKLILIHVTSPQAADISVLALNLLRVRRRRTASKTWRNKRIFLTQVTTKGTLQCREW